MNVNSVIAVSFFKFEVFDILSEDFFFEGVFLKELFDYFLESDSFFIDHSFDFQ